MDPFAAVLGRSDAAARLRSFGRRAAQVDAAVLLTGETGTGKGLLARGIHQASARTRQPFVAVNCAGVPEGLFESEFFGHCRGAFTGAQQAHRGLFEQAHAGTLFLDEVGELTPALQAKLLTTLDDGQVRRLGAERTVAVDARVIAATGQDLEIDVAEGRFRRDLYHRLLVLSCDLSPLRERYGDVDFFLSHFLDQLVDRYRRPIRGFDKAALARLRSHAWPGNIRELAHAVEAAILACDGGLIGLEHLPRTVAPASTATSPAPIPQPRTRSQRYSFYGSPEEERDRILQALRRCDGNKTRAAAALGMGRNTLRLKMRSLGLDGRKGPD